MMTTPPPGPTRAAVNVRRQRFAIAYAGHGVGKDAAISAGFSEHTARAQASRLLRVPAVLAAIEIERAERATRLRVDEDRITNAYAAIAFGDTRSVVSWDDKGVALISSSADLSDDDALLVQSVERKERTDAAGNVTSITTVKLADRMGALAALARIRGMNHDKLDVAGIEGFAAKLRERVARRKEEV